MSNIIEQLRELSRAPDEPTAFKAWLEGQDALNFLKANAREDDFVVYATPQYTFIHAVLVPASRVDHPDLEDLLSWNLTPYSSWGVESKPGNPESFCVSEPLESTGTKTFDGGQQLVFPRSFEGRIGEKGYWEVLQPFAHVFGLHFLEERQAWCRLDDRGDVEDVIRIIRFPKKGNDFGGVALIFKRDVLDIWMLLTNSVIIRTFDFTRYRQSSFGGWSQAANNPERTVDGDLIYRTVIEPGHASYVRGCQIVRPAAGQEALTKRFGWRTRDDEKEQYASFIAYDWKNKVIRDISCAPGQTANYFTESDLPYETSPAFFRPDVLLKYKSDSDKYRLEERSIHCRNTWSLQTYDINEAGQVHTYIVYLRDLLFEEQLYWKAYNEPPKAPISKRALKTDFEGSWDLEYEPLSSLKEVARTMDKQEMPWWTLRSERVLERVHYPATNSADEWADEILHLQQLLVEGLEEKWLRGKAKGLGRNPDSTLRSLKLIEECLIALRFEDDHARQLTAPLHALHNLRIKVKGHVAGVEADEIKKKVLAEHQTYRKHFETLCAECDEAIRTIGEAFKDFR